VFYYSANLGTSFPFCFVILLVDICYESVSRQQERSPSVIVIGGGMSGVAAARALHDASFQVFKQI